MFTIDELIQNPKRIKNMSSVEMIDTYMDEMVKDDTNFLKYIQFLYHYAPWAIDLIAFASSNSTYGLRSIFHEDDIAKMPPCPHFEYGSQDITAFMQTIKVYLTDGILKTSDGREKLMFMAMDLLSKDDYTAFSKMLKGEINPLVYHMLEKLWREKNLPQDIAHGYTWGFSVKFILEQPDGMFDNNSGTEEIVTTSSDVKLWVCSYGNVFEYNPYSTNLIWTFDAPESVYRCAKDSRHLHKYKTKPVIVITVGNDIIGIIHSDGIHYIQNSNKDTYTEVAFIKLVCNPKIKGMYIVRNGMIVGTVRAKNEDIITVNAKSFNIVNLPIGAGKLCAVVCTTKDNEEITMFTTKNEAEKISKSKKKFEYRTICGSNFLVLSDNES